MASSVYLPRYPAYTPYKRPIMTVPIATVTPMHSASGVPHAIPIAKSRRRSSVPIVRTLLPPRINVDSVMYAALHHTSLSVILYDVRLIHIYTARKTFTTASKVCMKRTMDLKCRYIFHTFDICFHERESHLSKDALLQIPLKKPRMNLHPIQQMGYHVSLLLDLCMQYCKSVCHGIAKTNHYDGMLCCRAESKYGTIMMDFQVHR